MPWLYRILRSLLVVFGLFIIAGGVFGFVFPDIAHSDSYKIPSLLDRTVELLFMVFFGMVYVLPYRFTSTSYLYWIRQIISIVIILMCIFMTINGLMSYRAGLKSQEIIPVTLIILFLATSLPLTLYWHKVNEKIK